MDSLSEQFLSLRQYSTGDFGIFLWKDGVLKTVFLTPRTLEKLSLSEEDFQRLTASDAIGFFYRSDREKARDFFSSVAKQKDSSKEKEAGLRIVSPKSAFCWAEVTLRYAGEGKEGSLVLAAFALYGLELDGTNALLNHAVGAFYVVDPKTYEVLYINQTGVNAWGGYEAKGQPCFRHLNRLTPCPWCGVPELKGRNYLQHPAHFIPEENRWASATYRRVQFFGREAVSVNTIDLTEEKTKQISLQFDRDNINGIINNVPVGVLVAEMKDGKVLSLSTNPLVRDMLGLNDNSTVFMTPEFGKKIHPDDRPRIMSVLKAATAASDSIRVDYRFRKTETEDYHYFRMECRSINNGDKVMAYCCLTDVTSEKNYERERNNLRGLYEAALTNTRLAIFEYDIAKHRITMANNDFSRAEFATLHLSEVLENVPDSIVSRFEEASVPALLEMYAKIDEGVPEASCEVWFKPQIGIEARCERITYRTVFDERGKPLRAQGVSQDITREKLEQRKYVLMYEQLANANLDALGSYRIDLTDNRCLTSESPLPGRMGHGEFQGVEGFVEALVSLVPTPEKREEIYRISNRAKLLTQFQAGITQLSVDYPVTASNDSLLWVRGTINLVRNPENGHIEAIAYATDITNSHLNDLILAQVAKENSDFIGILDPLTSRFFIHNGHWTEPTLPIGKTISFSEAKSYFVSCLSDDKERGSFSAGFDLESLQATLEKQPAFDFSYDFLAPQGGVRRKQIVVSYLSNARRFLLIRQTDVTLAFQKEQAHLKELKEALLTAEKASQAKTDFVSRISHDIRTPLNGIRAMTAFAKEDIADKDKLLSDLDKIDASSVFLYSLVNDVLDISKIDSGNIQLRPEPYPYDEFIGTLNNMFTHVCEERGLHFSVKGTANSVILADHTRLNQIFLNLLSNAVKYTPQGGSVSLTTEGKEPQNGTIACHFEIEDTGIGMSEEFAAKVFEPFSQDMNNAARAKLGGGTGLGLTIVKSLVTLMGGTIQLTSVLGKGTKILLDFVFPEASEEQITAYQQSKIDFEKAAKASLLKGKILLAEDNPINTEIAMRILASFGLEVVHAENGEEALHIFGSSNSNEYRLILMDIQMPILDGNAAAIQIRQLQRSDAKSIPIIAMTADAFADAMERSKAAGMNDYITKPINPAHLRDVLAHYLG